MIRIQLKKKYLITLPIFFLFLLAGFGLYIDDNAYAVQWPVKSPEYFEDFPKNISSDFGPRELGTHPMHDGIDFKCDLGNPVYSLTDGRVVQTPIIKRQGLNGYGFSVVIESGDYYYLYGHMYYPSDKYKLADDPATPKNVLELYKKIDLKEEAEVTKGQIIGYADNTGSSTNKHLHLTVAKNWGETNIEKINPFSLDIFDYEENPPKITGVTAEADNPKYIFNYPDPVRYLVYYKTKQLKINATVEDTEKDLNSVSFTSNSSPPLSQEFVCPTTNFSEYALKDGLLEKSGFPIKIKPGDVDTKDRSTDTFVLDWLVSNVKKAGEFTMSIKAKDIKEKEADKQIEFVWADKTVIESAEIVDKSNRIHVANFVKEPYVEGRIAGESGGVITVSEQASLFFSTGITHCQ